jgi:hypothetical protein
MVCDVVQVYGEGSYSAMNSFRFMQGEMFFIHVSRAREVQGMGGLQDRDLREDGRIAGGVERSRRGHVERKRERNRNGRKGKDKG